MKSLEEIIIKEFPFAIDKEYNHFNWYSVDYKSLTKIVNLVFDWDYVDSVCTSIADVKNSDSEQVKEYMETFLYLIKNVFDKYGNEITDENDKENRRKELFACINQNAKYLG